jgi:UTP--glucose-1-phosphate uridylyltransferase
MSVKKAVIPAAGLGTRFLPATKAQPKEMIPVIDRPGIQYVVEEAVRAGIEQILIITSRGKSTMEDHFDRAVELEKHLEASGKLDELEEIRRIGSLADIHYTRQKEPLGFGHAVSLAKSFAAGDPFVVMVADELVPERKDGELELLPRMLRDFEADGVSILAVQEVDLEEISSYGVVTPVPGDHAESVPISDMVEKPPRDAAPSNLAARGRYVFSAEIFDALSETKPGVGGEIQLTDAIRLLAHKGRMRACIYDGPIFDVGKKLDYLKASVQMAMRRDDLEKPFKDWLRSYVESLD